MSSSLVYNRVGRLEIQSVMLVFSTPLVNWRPSNLVLSTSSAPPPLSLVLTRFRTYKIALRLQGASENKTPAAR
jgi:hypothetical protein